MSKPRPDKIFGSDVLDDLLKEQANPQGQHWLLSYLDVFVLVVMLMVTLVAIEEPKSSQKKAKRKIEKVFKLQATPTPVVIPSPVVAITPTPQPTVSVKQSTINAEKQLERQLNEEITRLGLEKQVKMSVKQGRAQFDMQENVLFDSSAVDLSPAGEDLLLGLIPLLIESEGPILIEGHSDNRPLKSKQFRSNWELSSARANNVLHFLASQDVDVNRMRAISFGDTKPIADNKTKVGRDKNRRVNIVIQIEDMKFPQE